jgi:hypothetical protein
VKKQSCLRIPVAVLSICLAVALAGCGAEQNAQRDGAPGEAQKFDAESFFHGKTVRLVITQDVGGTTDVAARFIGTHLREFIPGKPNVEVTNVPDIAGLNRVYSAPADRLVIGATSTAQGIYVSAGEAGAEHDPEKVRIIGAIEPAARGIVLSSDTGYADIRSAEGKQAPVLRYAGSVGGAEDITEVEMLMPWLCDHMSLPCEFIQVADDDSATINLMQERGEINIQAGGLASRLRNLRAGFEAGKFRLGAVWELGDADLDLPQGTQMPPELSEMIPAEDAEAYQQLIPMISTGGLAVPLWAGPAMPDDVFASLRDAMSGLLGDTGLLTELSEVQAAEAIAVPGDEANELFRKAAKTYADNRDAYTQMQERYWTEYWGVGLS